MTGLLNICILQCYKKKLVLNKRA